jgi:hypothetical protein
MFYYYVIPILLVIRMNNLRVGSNYISVVFIVFLQKQKTVSFTSQSTHQFSEL